MYVASLGSWSEKTSMVWLKIPVSVAHKRAWKSSRVLLKNIQSCDVHKNADAQPPAAVVFVVQHYILVTFLCRLNSTLLHV